MNQILVSPSEVSLKIASSAREKRLSLNLSQQSLSKSSGVSHAVIKKFESTGKISLESLLKIAMALGCLNEFTDLFKSNSSETFISLDELINKKTRKRGRK
jgi:transcriptional regulator with XRE-family HTH domain